MSITSLVRTDFLSFVGRVIELILPLFICLALTKDTTAGFGAAIGVTFLALAAGEVTEIGLDCSKSVLHPHLMPMAAVHVKDIDGLIGAEKLV